MKKEDLTDVLISYNRDLIACFQKHIVRGLDSVPPKPIPPPPFWEDIFKLIQEYQPRLEALR